MSSVQSLDRLEQAVLERIQAHRALQQRRRVPIALALAACALATGLGVGVSRAQRSAQLPPSEVAVLADDAALAPSTLLASAQ